MARSVDDLILLACTSLTTPKHRLPDAHESVPDRAGLYAIHAATETWRQLGLGEPPDTRPLYVGKAEESLVSRDLNTHFRAGRTGQSTVRRTFAALLRDELGLRGIPRNQEAPERPANFALSAEHDEALNTWMNLRLKLAVWAKPAECTNLRAIEIAVFAKWSPPLNVRDNVSLWRTKVSAARKVMANDARSWATARGLKITRS